MLELMFICILRFKRFVILLELIAILKDRGSARSGLELWFRVASWHIGLDHMQLHCLSSY